MFSKELYKNLSDILDYDGILVTQAGFFFLQSHEFFYGLEKLKRCFEQCGYYNISVPTYYGGYMTLSYASHGINPAVPMRECNLDELKVYNSDFHKGCFMLPNFLKKEF